MSRNPYKLDFRSASLLNPKKKEKATLGSRDKTFLYNRAKHRCENCGKKLSFDDMQSGHKNKARSKGGKATLPNSVCLCYTCNKDQGTDSWATFRRNQGLPVKATATSRKKSKRKSKRRSKRSSNPFALPRLRAPRLVGF